MYRWRLAGRARGKGAGQGLRKIGLFAAMRQVGIDPNYREDVAIVQQISDMNLFLERKIDAAQAMIYNEYFQVLQAKNPKTGKKYSPSDLVKISMEEIGTGLPQDGIYTRTKWLAENNHEDVTVLSDLLDFWYCTLSFILNSHLKIS